MMRDLRCLHVVLSLIMHHRTLIVRANGLDPRVFKDWVRAIDLELAKAEPDGDRVQYLLAVIGCWIAVVPQLEEVGWMLSELVSKREPLELSARG